MAIFDYITLSQASKQCPNRPSSSAIWRWCRKGVQSRAGERVCLKHVRIGRKIYTTRQWLDEYFLAVAKSDLDHFSQEAHPPQTILKKSSKNINQREKSVQQAEIILAKAGI